MVHTNSVPLSIVLPCYNPPGAWTDALLDAFTQLESNLGFTPDIIVVNDGGPNIDDEFLQLQQKFPRSRLVGYPANKGKGAAVRYGITQANTEYTIYTDIDFPYTTDSFLKLWEGLYDGAADVMVGVKDEAYYKEVPPNRVFISKLLRKFIGIFFRMPITDTQCGLKGFNKKGKSIMTATTINRYLFDLEFVYQCFRHRPPLRVKAQAVRLKDNIQFRKMNYRVLLSEGWNFLKILLR